MFSSCCINIAGFGTITSEMDSLVTSNIRQRPLRSAISVIGVALGVALVMLFTGLARGMSNDLQRRSSNVRGEIIFTRKGSIQMTSSSTNLSVKYAERLQQIEGVESVTPVIRYIYQSGSIGFDQVDGVEWNDYSRMNKLQIVEGRGPEKNDEVIIDQTKAKRNHVARRIDQELPGNNVQLTRDVFTSIETSIPSLGVFLRILVGLAAVISALVVMLAMHTTITERTREIGILKAMGASRAYIVGAIEREALLISAMGLVVGFAIAGASGFMIHKMTSLIFEYGWLWALTAAAIGLLGGAIGALYPAMRAANLDPVAALSYE
jgi:ABC-type antimicrobial peptide transport system permease subunit